VTWLLATYHCKHEQVFDQIARRNLTVDCYCPTVDEPVDVGGRIAWHATPAFLNYLFVSTRLPKTNTELSTVQLIRYIDQVSVSPVILGNWIANITDEKLGEVRASVEKLNALNKCRVNAGDFAVTYIGKIVLITSGKLGGILGEVTGRTSGNDIVVEIPFFDQVTPCKVSVSEVQLV
jgi:hypothetical protein